MQKVQYLNEEFQYTRKLNDMFYEFDVAYIDTSSKESGHQGMSTTKQPVLAILPT